MSRSMKAANAGDYCEEEGEFLKDQVMFIFLARFGIIRFGMLCVCAV
jgi:hypothetical protein